MSFRPKKKSGIISSELPKHIGGSSLDYGEALIFPIYHGDLVVMHGTKIHRLYDVGST
jgi:hypothetical protein